MNRYIIGIIFGSLLTLMVQRESTAQIRMGASNQQWIAVSNSRDQVFSNTFQIQIDLDGQNVSYPLWNLGMVLNQPITNSEGKTYPFNKIKFRLSAVNGMTFQQIGSGTTAIPLSSPSMSALFINKSNAPIANGNGEYHRQVVFTVEMLLEGGSYMDALKSWNNYVINLGFVFYDRDGRELLRSSAVNSMQVQPNGSYESPASYAIQVQDNARSGLLELKTMNDYVNGAAVNYANGLTVTAATPYAIQVRTGSAQFSSGHNSLPVSVVNLSLSAANNSGMSTITLSENNQTVLRAGSSTSTSELFRYHIKYFTKPNDSRLNNAASETYSGIVIYEIVPQ